MPAQHRSAAPAARSARVYVHVIGAVNQNTAVFVYRFDVDPLKDQQFIQKLAADFAQIARVDRVKLRRVRFIRPEKPLYGVRRRR